MMNSEKFNNTPTFLRVKLVLIGLNIQMFSKKKIPQNLAKKKSVLINTYLEKSKNFNVSNILTIISMAKVSGGKKGGAEFTSNHQIVIPIIFGILSTIFSHFQKVPRN